MTVKIFTVQGEKNSHITGANGSGNLEIQLSISNFYKSSDVKVSSNMSRQVIICYCFCVLENVSERFPQQAMESAPWRPGEELHKSFQSSNLSATSVLIACRDISEDLASRRRGQRQTHNPPSTQPAQLLPLLLPQWDNAAALLAHTGYVICVFVHNLLAVHVCVCVCVCQRGLCHCCRPPPTICRYFTVTD